jgi:hypothetical protein
VIAALSSLLSAGFPGLPMVIGLAQVDFEVYGRRNLELVTVFEAEHMYLERT